MNNKNNKKKIENKELMQQQVQNFYLQIQQLQQQLEIIAQQKMQFEMMVRAIKEMQTIDDKERETMVSLTPGIFIKAKINKPKKVIINVGQNIMVEKGLNDAIGLLREQIETLNKNEDALKTEFNSLIGGM